MGGENVILYRRITQDKNIVFAEHFNAHFQNGWNRENISPKNSLPQKLKSPISRNPQPPQLRILLRPKSDKTKNTCKV